MSTIRDAAWAEEDDPEDESFAGEGRGSSPSSSVSGSGDDDDAAPRKRRRLDDDERIGAPAAQAVPAEEVAELWSTFESAAGQATPSQSLLDRNRIQIKRIVQFAGECYEEDVEVWNDSEEAQAYLARPPRPLDAPAPTAPAAAPADKPIDRSTANYGQGYERRQAEPAGTTSSSGPIKRPRKSLASMAASITGKPTKINSLEKSKMDWNRYVERNSLTEDLDAGRKDSFTERQAFLERTHRPTAPSGRR